MGGLGMTAHSVFAVYSEGLNQSLGMALRRPQGEELMRSALFKVPGIVMRR